MTSYPSARRWQRMRMLPVTASEELRSLAAELANKLCSLHGRVTTRTSLSAQKELLRMQCSFYWRRRQSYPDRVFVDQINLYLRYHGRLPGSQRTSRLRKKRVSVVNRFCDRQYRQKQRKHL